MVCLLHFQTLKVFKTFRVFFSVISFIVCISLFSESGWQQGEQLIAVHSNAAIAPKSAGA